MKENWEEEEESNHSFIQFLFVWLDVSLLLLLIIFGYKHMNDEANDIFFLFLVGFIIILFLAHKFSGQARKRGRVPRKRNEIESSICYLLSLDLLDSSSTFPLSCFSWFLEFNIEDETRIPKTKVGNES